MERNTDSVRLRVRLLVVAAAALLVVGPASAHDLKMGVDLKADPVTVEAWFDGGIPAQDARVTVVRDTGEEMAAGTTDERGMWSFPKPGPGKYRITVESVGHRDVIRFTVGDPNAAEENEPIVEGDTRLNRTLGLSIGLTLLLGGSAAFIAIRRMKAKRAAS